MAQVLHDASAKERACFYQYHVDGLSMRELADLVGCSKGYVSKLVAKVEARILEARIEGGYDG